MGYQQVLNSEQKAFEINLNSTIYDTFTEIGAKQEMARHFFRAGGTAETIAKSMSAYDMTVSNAIFVDQLVQRDHVQTGSRQVISHLGQVPGRHQRYVSL